ncbi:MAG: peptidoglycan DD-metalloendopeptidase family protein [bacterium]|nr:peptidoglycan DD-metalloendopeptidase family protein [bacterium]
MKFFYLICIAFGVVAIAIAGGIFARFHIEETRPASLPLPTFPNTPIRLPEAKPRGMQEARPQGAPEVSPLGSSCDQTFAETLAPADRAAVCSRPKRLTEARGIEVDLTAGRTFLFDEGKIVAIEPLRYQAPEGMWYEAPTGYYRIGVKHIEHRSSLFPVTMPWSLQYYEDFFMHGIPYHDDGTAVSSVFTGGCLRFADEVAKALYDFLKTGDQIAVYKTFADLSLKGVFHAPVNLSNAWIRQRFINPYRSFYANSGSLDTLRDDYYSHTGTDFALNPDTAAEADPSVYAIADGTIELVQKNDGRDHGLGNTVVMGFMDGTVRRYALYAHLDTIAPEIVPGYAVLAGDVLGVMGNSGNGCRNYWKVGPDGCDTAYPNDTHLHFEIKDAPVLENPRGGEARLRTASNGQACRRTDGSARYCYGYTPGYPQAYGYHNPIEFLFDKVPGAIGTPSPTPGGV